MSPRSIEVLRNCEKVYAEDTRVSGKLWNHFGIETPLSSFHAHNEHKRLDSVIKELEGGAEIAFISDAGTPAISDPGFLLVRACKEKGIKVDCLPGPTAFVPALVESGFPINSFVFEGFLPQKKGRQSKIMEILEEKRTVVLYESPYRIIKLLEQLIDLGVEERPISISRELSKKFGETVGGTTSVLLGHFRKKEPKGEFVVVLGPR